MGSTMSIDDDTLGDEIIIPQKIFIENDIELDRDNTILVQTFVYADEEDEDPSEVTVKLEDMITNTIDYYAENMTNHNRTSDLYLLSNELFRLAEELRMKAEYMDRGLYSDDLFSSKEDLN